MGMGRGEGVRHQRMDGKEEYWFWLFGKVPSSSGRGKGEKRVRNGCPGPIKSSKRGVPRNLLRHAGEK